MLKPTVQVQIENGILVAEFWDCLRLDPQPVLELRKKYESHIRSQGHPNLVVDLLGVGFAGSAALGNFVALQRDVRQRGGRMIFCNVDPTVREAFRVSKLEPLFAFVGDKPAALELAQQASGAPASGSDGQSTPDQPQRPPSAPRPGPLRGSGGGVRRRRLT